MKSIDTKDLKKTPIAIIIFILALIYSAFLGIMISAKYDFFTEFNLSKFPLLIILLLIEVFISFIISIILHELGHLVFGLSTGYKFHSFQFFTIKLIKIDNKIKVKKATNMLLGQCVLDNDNDYKDIKYKLYMYGGSIFNLIFTILPTVIFVLIFVFKKEIISVLLIFGWINIMLFYSNGIPLVVNGIYNDSMNLKLMNKYDFIKEIVIKSLKLQREMEEKESINDVDNDLINSQNDVDNNIIHKYPFLVAQTIKRIVNNKENKFDLLLEEHKARRDMPIQYKYSNITFILYYYITNRISYKGILLENTYKTLFKNPSRYDALLDVNFKMIDYLENRLSLNDTVTYINNKSIELETKYTTKIEKECYQIMFKDAITYLNEIEAIRHES